MLEGAGSQWVGPSRSALKSLPVAGTQARSWDDPCHFQHLVCHFVGGVSSPVLANFALDGLERCLREAFPVQVMRNGVRQSTKVNLIRYADDFVITGRSKEQLETEVLPLVKQFLRERGLELSPEKTVVTHIGEGFDFLGQNVRKYKGKLLIKPSKDSVKSLLAEARGIIKANKQTTAGQLILQLDPVIRGWAYYHRHVVSSGTFRSVEHAIFKALWRWAKRRHPNKGARWVKDKYFHRKGSLKWVFSGEHDGQMRHLFSAASVPIRRHVKVSGEANPYDPAWETYFEHRRGVKMEAILKGRRTLLYLWKRQDGLCPRCNQPITSITGWHSHHVIWKSRGGSDEAANRVLLHPTCHRQLHCRETVPALRPAMGRS